MPTRQRKKWDIGNTTMRNPLRLAGALRVFHDAVEGSRWNAESQEAYWAALKAAGEIESEAVTERASFGRKFYSALRQLGFVQLHSDGTVSTTPVGLHLLAHPELLQQVMLRQLLKYRIGSPIEPQDLLSLRPFVAILRVLKGLADAGLPGLSLHEVALYLIPLQRDDDASIGRVVSQVLAHREEEGRIRGLTAKKRWLAEKYASVERATTAQHTLRDYADSSMRYVRLTGLVSASASSGRFELAASRADDIAELLAAIPRDVDDDAYVDHLHDPSEPSLPMDDEPKLDMRILRVQEEIERMGEEVAATQLAEVGPIPVAERQQRLFQLEALRDELRETEFYRVQRTRAALMHTVGVLRDIRSRKLAPGLHAPAYLEWAVWRLMLAINDLAGSVASSRGFKVDSEFEPLGHAIAGVPDTEFEYASDVLVGEVTLTTSGRQVAAEGEPVRRHIAHSVRRHAGKRVLGILVAPSIDPNTHADFYDASYYIDGDEIVTEIVPLTIDDVIFVIEEMLTHNRVISHADLLATLQMILDSRPDYRNGIEWGRAYPEVFRERVSEAVRRAGVVLS